MKTGKKSNFTDYDPIISADIGFVGQDLVIDLLLQFF